MKTLLSIIFLGLIIFISTACPPTVNEEDDDDDSIDDDDDDDEMEDDDSADDDDDNDDDEASAPSVVAMSPEDGDDELKLATVVSVTFSKSMETASVESAFTMNDETKMAVAGVYSWDDGNESMTFTPNDNLTEDMDYTVTIGTGATDTTGNSLKEESRLVFSTVNLWTRTYNGDSNGEDIGHDLTLDDQRNVYVTGEEWVTGEYANVWTRKYDKDGNVKWTSTFNGISDMRDVGYAIALDGDTNILVAGYSRVTDESDNIWLRMYDSEGVEAWTVEYNSPDNGYDVAQGVGVDAFGNVYIAGYETAVQNNRNILAAKYDQAGGVPSWIETYDGDAQGTDGGIAIAVDGEGNVFVTGYEYTSGEDNNIWLRKYDTEGQDKWTRRYNGVFNGSDVGKGIDIDQEGNILVTGYETIQGNGRDIWLRKYDSMGYEIWTVTYDGEQDEDEGHDVATDSMNNVIVVGYVHLSEENQNIFVRKYDQEGTILWTDTFNDETDGDDVAGGVVVDDRGNLYVTGCVTVSGEEKNIWLRKYDSDGNYSDD